MELGVSYQDVVEVLKKLPPARVVEVYDFACFLQSQRDMTANVHMSDEQAAFLATFGTWKDERSAEEIVADIYRSRTISEEERAW
jgi:hypothetical protein